MSSLLPSRVTSPGINISVSDGPEAKLEGYVKYPAGYMGAPLVPVTAKLGGRAVKTAKTNLRGYFSMSLRSNNTYDIQASRVLKTVVLTVYLPQQGVHVVLLLGYGRLYDK